jgi:3-phenylpropionate/trans-cinnamate dioxygenase ferredoxin subunit
MTGRWVKAVKVEEIAENDVAKWDFENVSYAIFRLGHHEFYVTANICTHEHALLSEGFLENGVIECPRHSGRFDIKTGEPLGAPVCDAIRTFPVKVSGDTVLILLDP